nr:hypothetical protein [Tanacetum cinerariifolium]
MDDCLERAATTATILDAKQDRGNIFKTQSKATPNDPGSQGTSSGGGPRCQEIIGDTVAQTRSKRVSKISNDPLLAGVNTSRSGKDSLKLIELMKLCTKLEQRVLDLETTNTTQALEIDSLKRRVKKLERKKSKEDAFKEGRIVDIDANKDIYLVNVHNDKDMFGVNDLDGDEVIVESVDVIEQAKEVVDDITLAKALMEIKTTSSRPKAKGLVIHEQEQVPTPMKDQLMLDEELAFKLQAEEEEKEEEEERIARENSQRVEEVNIAWDDVQVTIDADYELAQRLQAEEQEELTDVVKEKLFMQLLEKRTKFFTAKRAKEKRNRPPTRAQQRSIMCTYLKNMEGYKLKSLKNKSFDNIQEMFDKAMKRVNTFVDYRTELVLESLKKAEAKVTEGNLKRAGEELEQENAKKQKIEDDKESVELKECLEIIPDDGDDVTVDATHVSSNSLTIVDYKIYKERKKSYF